MKRVSQCLAVHQRLFDHIESLNLPCPYSEVDLEGESIQGDNKTHIVIRDTDTISAAVQIHKEHPEARIAVLNFASYQNPGGLFLQGSVAQEESLCYCTNLFGELCSHRDWYTSHKESLNQGLYTNASILTHNISVIGPAIDKYFSLEDIFQIDVLTCSAPNWTYTLKYHKELYEEARWASAYRVLYLMRILAAQNYDYVVLGAFGCGVFRNDPNLIAFAFKFTLETDCPGMFKHVVFAIPGKESHNYKAFAEQFKDSLAED